MIFFDQIHTIILSLQEFYTNKTFDRMFKICCQLLRKGEHMQKLSTLKIYSLHIFPLSAYNGDQLRTFDQQYLFISCRQKKIIDSWSKLLSSLIYWFWGWTFFNTVATIWCPYLATSLKYKTSPVPGLFW